MIYWNRPTLLIINGKTVFRQDLPGGIMSMGLLHMLALLGLKSVRIPKPYGGITWRH